MTELKNERGDRITVLRWEFLSSTSLWLLTLAVSTLVLNAGVSIQEDVEVGLNCSVDDCDEKPVCPPDSELSESWSCKCAEDKCTGPPDCLYNTKRVLKRKATKIPGDCCDIYDCTYESAEPTEVLNCSTVVCKIVEADCPDDSYRLPHSQTDGECCSKPMGCACLPGACPAPSCPKGQWHKVIRPGNGRPGTCCPLYQCYTHVSTNLNCSFHGKEILSGSKWKKSECIECTCNDGHVHCMRSVQCPKLPTDCPATRLPPGECCPTCIFNHNEIELAAVNERPGGCKSLTGVIYKNGATWQEDDCTTCTCVDGTQKCQAEMCHLTCANATFVKGECCPRCNGDSEENDNCSTLTNCSLSCASGFEMDEFGCLLCKCRKQEECHLECNNGFLKDGSGTEICECANECPSLDGCTKKCKHGYKLNRDGCEICKCEHCKQLVNCDKKCPHGLQTNQKGCTICKCKAPEQSNATLLEASFEKECLTDIGMRRDNGEAWTENCRQCYCLHGKEMCSLVSCPKVDCLDPIFSKDSCCPFCPGEQMSGGSEVLCYGPGGVRQELENWKQGCLECVCHNGSVLCHSEPCPPVLCQHPLQGDCCPVCPKEEAIGIAKAPIQKSCGERAPGEKWRQSECTSCVCINGEAVCYTQACDQIDTTCKKPVQLKNLCCPACLDNMADDKICQVGNMTFNVGDEWEPEKCTRCSCGPAHTISCTLTICERPCSKIDNPCCPKCSEVDGGYTFLHTPIYMTLICIFMFVVGAGSVILWKRCQLRRHQLKICQPSPDSYHYKYVPSYEHNTPSPHKSPV